MTLIKKVLYIALVSTIYYGCTIETHVKEIFHNNTDSDIHIFAKKKYDDTSLTFTLAPYSKIEMDGYVPSYIDDSQELESYFTDNYDTLIIQNNLGAYQKDVYDIKNWETLNYNKGMFNSGQWDIIIHFQEEDFIE